MDLAKFQINNEILKLLYQEERIFIQVIDKVASNSKKVEIYRLGENWEDGFFCKIDSSIYLSATLSDKDLTPVATWINKLSHLHSIYGLTSILVRLQLLLEKRVKNRYDYYVMELTNKTFKYPPLEYLRNCRFCNERDFALLKDLQKQYHLEEVYTSEASYPYNYEMAAFKHTLQHRKNAALFVNSIAASKVYITAESSDRYQLGGIFTRKQYRGQGCAWKVLSFFIYAIWQAQYKKKIFQLFVKKNNLAAYNLYKKVGFTEKDETSYFYY
jgi:predicted GNAT family acetyltransferase